MQAAKLRKFMGLKGKTSYLGRGLYNLNFEIKFEALIELLKTKPVTFQILSENHQVIVKMNDTEETFVCTSDKDTVNTMVWKVAG